MLERFPEKCSTIFRVAVLLVLNVELFWIKGRIQTGLTGLYKPERKSITFHVYN
jgi:hypothetical protein